MSVLIGIACGESSRNAIFWAHLQRLIKPAGTCLLQERRGMNIARARNALCQAAIDGGFSHLMFFDDDHSMPPHTLQQLLATGLDIVSGLYLTRQYPFTPVAYGYWEGEDAMPLRLKGLEGLVEVSAVGAGCLLISTEALKRIGAPWFTLGSPSHPDLIREDFNFCRKATDAGEKIYVDLDLLIGHYANLGIAPWRTAQGQWATAIISGEQKLFIPDAWALAEKRKMTLEAVAGDANKEGD